MNHKSKNIIISTILDFIEKNTQNNMKLLPRKKKKDLKTIKFETLTCIIYENFILMRIRRKFCEQKMASSKDYQQLLAVIVRFFLKMLKTKIRTKYKSEISVGSISSLSQILWTRTKVINSRMKHGAELSSSHISEKKFSQKNIRFRLSVKQI